MGQNYANAFRSPMRADIDRDVYSNALLKNEVDRLPQQNKMQDLAIQGVEQNQGQNRQANARKFLGDVFTGIAQSQDPINTGRTILGNSSFQAALRDVGMDPAQFTITDQDTPESLQKQSADLARVFAGGGEQLPVGARNFDIMAHEANLSPEERSRAARVDLGLTPRAVDMRERNPPSGYEWTPEGTLKATTGGPADPMGPNLRRNSTALRKEYEDQKAVSDYRLVLPVYQRAATAEDTRAGDISIIYALGKIFDPGSVVREGELQLSMQAAPWLQQLVSNAKSQITGEGRLNPALRAELVRAMGGQVDALRAPYQQERERYAGYATDFGFEANSVVGPDPAAAFPRLSGGGQDGVPQDVTEEDIAFTMQKHGMTREQVLQALGNAP